MTRDHIFIPILLTLLVTASSAQKKRSSWDQWGRSKVIEVVGKNPLSKGLSGTIAGLLNDKFIIAGGTNFPDLMPWEGGKKKYYNTIFLIERSDKRFSSRQLKATLPLPVAYAATCLTSSGILFAGGENENGISDKVFILRVDNSLGEILVATLPPLPIPLTNAAAAVKDHTVFVGGGETTSGTSNAFFAIDLTSASSGWIRLPDLPQPTAYHVLLTGSYSGSSCIFLIGGRKKTASGISDLYNNLYCFDLSTRSWQQKASLPYPLSAAAGLLLDNEQVIIFGGDKGTVFSQVESLIARIASEKDENIKEKLNQEKIRLQSTHPGFNKDVLRYDPRHDRWEKIGYINLDPPVTTTAVNWKGFVILPCGETRPGVRTPYMLYHPISTKLHD